MIDAVSERSRCMKSSRPTEPRRTPDLGDRETEAPLQSRHLFRAKLRSQHGVAGSSVSSVAAPSVKEMDFSPYNG
jgi:hypothetical protein